MYVYMIQYMWSPRRSLPGCMGINDRVVDQKHDRPRMTDVVNVKKKITLGLGKAGAAKTFLCLGLRGGARVCEGLHPVSYLTGTARLFPMLAQHSVTVLR